MNELLLKHFDCPQGVGQFEVQTPRVYSAKLGVSDVVQLQIKLDQNDRIEQAYFKACGNPYLIAAMSWLTTELKGKTIEQAKKINYIEMIKQFAMPETKVHTALLVEDVLQAVIRRCIDAK